MFVAKISAAPNTRIGTNVAVSLTSRLAWPSGRWRLPARPQSLRVRWGRR